MRLPGRSWCRTGSPFQRGRTEGGNPDQYETIAAGDLDGDGRAELVGRNASHVEIFLLDTAVAVSALPRATSQGGRLATAVVILANGCDSPTGERIDSRAAEGRLGSDG